MIECKASLKHHESKNRDKYKDYAVDGALLYAGYLKDDFNVIAIGISGQTDRELKISHYLWLKGKHIYGDVNDKVLLTPSSLLKIVKEQSKPLNDEELIKKAIEYNETLHKHSIPEIDRCTIISSILVALQDNAFTRIFDTFHKELDEDNKEYNPNQDLIQSLLAACERVLKKNKIEDNKKTIILSEYGKIKSHIVLSSRNITVKRKTELNTVLRTCLESF